jgi:hypothetical protein
MLDYKGLVDLCDDTEEEARCAARIIAIEDMGIGLREAEQNEEGGALRYAKSIARTPGQVSDAWINADAPMPVKHRGSFLSELDAHSAVLAERYIRGHS